MFCVAQVGTSCAGCARRGLHVYVEVGGTRFCGRDCPMTRLKAFQEWPDLLLMMTLASRSHAFIPRSELYKDLQALTGALLQVPKSEDAYVEIDLCTRSGLRVHWSPAFTALERIKFLKTRETKYLRDPRVVLAAGKLCQDTERTPPWPVDPR